VDSALAQTYDDFEILVVDDGSRDMTSELVSAYSSEKIRLLSLAFNGGESTAMNEGIAVARGQLIAFLDADDEWLPDKLAKQIAVLSENPDAVMVSCGCRFVDTQGNVLREFGMPPPNLDKNQAWQQLLAGSFIAKPCVVARTTALRSVGSFDTSLLIGADQDMWIRLAMMGPVEFVAEFLTIVHDTASSLTKVYANKIDRYVLPMIKRHIHQQRDKLPSHTVRSILGERYTAVGRILYKKGSLIRGTALITHAVGMGHDVWANLWCLVTASPPVRTLKRLVFHPPTKPRMTDSANESPGGLLLRPQEQDLVVPPLGPPILMVMIDAEAEFDWNGPFLRTLVSVRNLSRQITVQEIFDGLGVRPTFLVDYAVATQSEGYGPIRELLQSGRCEVGTHLQPWETPPFAEELSVPTSFNHNLPAWLQREKLLRLTDAIVKSFGVTPSAYRAGRYGVGEEIAWILSSLGYQIDLSVLPGHDLRRRHGPDFRRAFSQPYRFGPDRALLEIPLTSGFSGLLAYGGDPAIFNASLYAAISRPVATRWHLPGAFARLGLLERISLTPEGRSIQELKRLTQLLLRRGQRVFTFNYHSSALLPGYTPYVGSHSDLDRMVRTIEEYLHYFIEEIGGITMTPMEFRSTVMPAAAAQPVASVGIPTE
jgi:GT2 family glycosyltransferase